MIVSYVLLFLLFVTLHGTTAQNKCTTPENNPGVCISIHFCESMIEYFEDRRHLTREYVNYIERFFCGFDGRHPKICCEKEVWTLHGLSTIGTSSHSKIADPPRLKYNPNLSLINSDDIR